jgi:hypothetical protein
VHADKLNNGTNIKLKQLANILLALVTDDKLNKGTDNKL